MYNTTRSALALGRHFLWLDDQRVRRVQEPRRRDARPSIGVPPAVCHLRFPPCVCHLPSVCEAVGHTNFVYAQVADLDRYSGPFLPWPASMLWRDAGDKDRAERADPLPCERDAFQTYVRARAHEQLKQAQADGTSDQADSLVLRLVCSKNNTPRSAASERADSDQLPATLSDQPSSPASTQLPRTDTEPPKHRLISSYEPSFRTHSNASKELDATCSILHLPSPIPQRSRTS